VATNKPKVSAYLPQHLLDRFEQFRNERKLTTSAATALVLATYFELNLLDVDDSVLTRLAKLEQSLIAVQANLDTIQAKRSRKSTTSKPTQPIASEDPFVQVELFSPLP
jgi:hypothetical protein